MGYTYSCLNYKWHLRITVVSNWGQLFPLPSVLDRMLVYASIYFACKETDLTKGVLAWENSRRRQFHTKMTTWFRTAFTWFVLLEEMGLRSPHPGLRHIEWNSHFSHFYNPTLILRYMSEDRWKTPKLLALWSEIFRYFLTFLKSRCTEERPVIVVLRLHDTVARFRTGMKFSPRYITRGGTRAGTTRSGTTFSRGIM